MNKIRLMFAVALLVNVLIFANSAYNPLGKMRNIVSKIWVNWETEGDEKEGGNWKVIPSKFVNKAEGVTFGKVYDSSPDSLGDSKSSSTKCFGFQTGFTRKGYNYVDVMPEKSLDSFPGHIQSLDLWVWGGNFNYNLEIQLEDYQGYIWTLPMGNLKYYGWRNLNTVIPKTIPQAEPYAPRKKGLTFNKFRFYAAPSERADRFNCFIDYFKIVTDTYRDQYDGHDLEKLIAKDDPDSNPIEKNETAE